MKLIIGLGNPGEKYENTRHNMGFLVVEKIAEKKGITFRLESMYDSRFAEMAAPATPEHGDGGQGDLENRIKLVEPQTFMNESGRAVSKTKIFYKVDSEDIWVIHDDVDLELGKIKIQLGGSSAGHKGVQSIIDNIGEEFWRIRIGVGRDEKIATEDWVLMKFSDADGKAKKVAQIVDKVAGIVLEFLSKEITNKSLTVEA